MDSNHFTYNAPFGQITIFANAGNITRVALGQVPGAGVDAPSAVTNRCATELQEYFAGKRTVFDVPLDICGSDFQLAIWRAADAIPYGQTRTPAQIAEIIGRPASYRLVMSAAAKNPLAILVPTHRICPANGKEAGRSGATRAAKVRAALRQLERKHL